MRDRQNSQQQSALDEQISQFLNIDKNRVTIDNDRAIIKCASDRDMYEIQEQWCSASMHFYERVKYIVLQKGDRSVELPISIKMWSDQSVFKPM